MALLDGHPYCAEEITYCKQASDMNALLGPPPD
jgi:hypothetical protein